MPRVMYEVGVEGYLFHPHPFDMECAKAGCVPVEVVPKAQLDEVYEDRNLLMMLLLHEWTAEDGECWITDDPAEPEWPVITFDIFDQQVSYHVPASMLAVYEDHHGHHELHHCNEAQPCWPRHKWDGHTSAEKRERIRDYLRIGR